MTTTEKPKAIAPPIDTDGSISKAVVILKRFRKQLQDLPPEWRQWVIDSLAASDYGD